MMRFLRAFGALVVLGIASLVLFSIVEHTPIHSAVTVPSEASSTLAVVPNATSTLSPTQIQVSTTTQLSTSSPSAPSKKKINPPSKPVVAQATTSAPASSSTTALPPPIPVSSDAALNAAASVLRNALVNIICYAPNGSPFHSISGSGVIISSKGIILTDAHVAQYFLLADRGVSCEIRTGGPAKTAYDAAPIFVSPAWLNANPTAIMQDQPIGTGEHDFALLAITDSATDAPLPVIFPSISFSEVPPPSLIPVVIASYGAQFLDPAQVESSLFPTIVFGSIKDVYTFNVNTVDVLALGGSAAAQEGSSGGGVADANGDLIGAITTSTVDGSTDTRSLDAITTSYIRADYASQTGSAIDLLLGESTTTAVANFAPQIPALEKIITNNLPS